MNKCLTEVLIVSHQYVEVVVDLSRYADRPLPGHVEMVDVENRIIRTASPRRFQGDVGKVDPPAREGQIVEPVATVARTARCGSIHRHARFVAKQYSVGRSSRLIVEVVPGKPQRCIEDFQLRTTERRSAGEFDRNISEFVTTVNGEDRTRSAGNNTLDDNLARRHICKIVI